MSEETGPLEMPGKPGRSKKSSGEVRLITHSERVRNYCIGIGALSALILGLVATFKGEPVAEKTWDTLSEQLNKQAVALKRLHSRMVYFQAHEEGRHAADIQLKLEDLQKRYDTLKSGTPERKIKISGTTIVCRPGYVEADGKCRKATKAVVKRVATEVKATASARKSLLVEKRKTKKLETKLKSIKQQARQMDDLPALRPLPKKLDDVADKK